MKQVTKMNQNLFKKTSKKTMLVVWATLLSIATLTAAQPKMDRVGLSGGCGDGVRSYTEVCDDGNALSGDGCSFDCQLVETGFECNYNPVVNHDTCTKIEPASEYNAESMRHLESFEENDTYLLIIVWTLVGTSALINFLTA